jgi:hypothetical protein
MKTSKLIFSAAAAVVLLSVSLPVSAFYTTVEAAGTYFSQQSGVTTVDFGISTPNDSLPVVGSSSANDIVYSGTSGSVNYNYYDGALYNITTSSITDVTARPVGSMDNFWSVGPSPSSQVGPGEVTFNTGLSYYGFLWGSPDAYNTVSFYDGSTLLGAYTGTAVLDPAQGDQDYSRYFNAFAGPNQEITKVIFESTLNAFETDNHAFISAIPEPETYAMLLAGLGLLGLMGRRRKQKDAAAA